MKKLLLIDANSLIHRAFHALPPLTYNGKPSGALFGLSSILIKVIKEQKPDFLAAAFDRPEKTFRAEIFKDYKATRPKAPQELIDQIIEAHHLFQAFNIPCFELAGFEADDILGSLSTKFKTKDDLKIVILTGDLDALQLVEDEKIVVEILKKGVSETLVYNEEAVIQRFGLKPKQLPDFKSLVGDKSDNIPGVKGIGPKTASQLIQKYQSLENLLNSSELSDKTINKIKSFSKIALLSKKLATIQINLPLKINLSDLQIKIETKKIKDYFYGWGFFKLIERLENNDVVVDTPNLFTHSNQTLENKEDIKTLNAFFIEQAQDIDAYKTLSKNIKVAWDWKPIIKQLLLNQRQIPQNIFDLQVAFWLLYPSETINQEIVAKKILNKNSLILKEDWKNVFLILKNKLEKNNLHNIFWEIEMPLVEVLAFMENQGIKINLSLAHELKTKIQNQLNQIEKEVYSLTKEKFNLNSPKQVSQILFEKLKIKAIKKTTKSGIISTAFETLSQIQNEPLVNLILEYRELFKISSTYLDAILQTTDQRGRLHTTYLQTGTSTGRIASKEPNLQNIPQESTLAKDVRSIFEAEKNFTLVSFDYSQLELRLLAHLAQEHNLLEAFQNNVDIHQLTASKILKIPLQKVSPKERRLGKTLNFGMIYGMGAKSLALTAGIPLGEAKKFIQEYFETFPQIKAWQENIKKTIYEKGVIENIFGRKRWFFDFYHPKIKAENERAAINMPVQSLGADILKKCMIKIYQKYQSLKKLDRARMILTIHDELIFEIQNDILKNTILEIKEIMENTEKLSVPLKVDIKTGPNWGNLNQYELN